MDTYLVKEADSFYFDYSVHYFNHKNFIIAIKYLYNINNYDEYDKISMATYDCNTGIFTKYVDLKKIEDPKNILNISVFDVQISRLYLFDCDNNEYSKSCEFPYNIYEIDGNDIRSCMDNDYIYVFHSITIEYETGLFKYSIKKDTFNNSDFYKINMYYQHYLINNKFIDDDNFDHDIDYNKNIEMYTNKFVNLHKKNIISCYYHKNGLIYILYNEFYGNDDYTIALYDLMNDKIIKIVSGIKYSDILLTKNEILTIPIYHKHTDICVYNIDGTLKKIILLPNDKQTIHAAIVNNNIILLRYLYVNPFGQIYNKDHDECGSNHMEIRTINIE